MNITKGKTPRLPEFIIPGGQRCGTTTFYNKLMQHPEIAPAQRKEVHYFDLRSTRGIGWYKAMFPAMEDAKFTGDASPYYLPHPLCARRIYEACPDVKIIVMLRDPVRRAYSHYHHSLRAGKEDLGFREAIEAEEERLADAAEYFANEPHAGFHPGHNLFSYLYRGRYYEQLKEYFELFEGRIKIVRSEDYYQYPQQVLQDAVEFIGVEDTEFEFDTGYDGPKYENPVPPMEEDIENELYEYFAPFNKELEDAIGVPMDWELRGRPITRITFKADTRTQEEIDASYEPDEADQEFEAYTSPSNPEEIEAWEKNHAAQALSDLEMRVQDEENQVLADE